jgi:hypothetical protein
MHLSSQYGFLPYARRVLQTWPCTAAPAAPLVPLLVLHEPVVLVAHPKQEVATRRRLTQEELARRARPLLRLRWLT